MKITHTFLVSLISIFLGTLYGSKPSVEMIQFVSDRVNALVENSESKTDEELFAQSLQDITREHGLEGIAWLGFKEPLVLETFLDSDSVGLRYLSLALLKQASSNEEMSKMLVSLIVAQIRSSIDPFEDEHIVWLKEGCMASGLLLPEMLYDQLISQALVSGVEEGESQVQSATFRYRLQDLNGCKAVIKKIGFTCFIKDWDHCISQHKPDYSYTYKKNVSYQSQNYFKKRW